jgi:PleD family two-component response regulator
MPRCAADVRHTRGVMFATISSMETAIETIPGALRASARVLTVGHGKGIADAVAGVEAAGHSVFRVNRAEEALDTISVDKPDVVIVESFDGTEAETLEFCAAVRESAAPPPPAVFLLSQPPVTDTMRKEAWRAGVWHIAVAPADPEELLLRVDSAVAARRDADRAVASNLVDPETGLYNAAGFARRTREVSAEAMRTHSTLACVVITSDVQGAVASRNATARSAEVLRTVGRVSDIVGRVGPMDYAVLAPATKEAGAASLARRLAMAFRVALIQALPAGAYVRTQAGFCTMPNLAYEPLDPAEILARAMAALRVGSRAPYFEWVDPLDINPRTKQASNTR